MIEELVYTSAPQGLKPGSHGFCTVASTPGMTSTLAALLESLSAYRHLGDPGDDAPGANPPAYSHLRAVVGGKPVQILSRVGDAGFDYSGRSNKIAHHVCFAAGVAPECGPVALQHSGQLHLAAWTDEPRILPPRPSLPAAEVAPAACRYWQEITGDAGWGGIVGERLSGARPKDVWLLVPPNADTLRLLAESIAVLPPGIRWRATYSTYFTKLPPGIDCRVRCVVDGTPEAIKLRKQYALEAIDLCRQLGDAPTSRWTDSARSGKPLEHARAPNVVDDPPSGAAAEVEAFPQEVDLASVSMSSPPPLPTPRAKPLSRPRRDDHRGAVFAVIAIILMLSASVGGGYYIYRVVSEGIMIAQELAPAVAERAAAPEVHQAGARDAAALEKGGQQSVPTGAPAEAAPASSDASSPEGGLSESNGELTAANSGRDGRGDASEAGDPGMPPSSQSGDGDQAADRTNTTESEDVDDDAPQPVNGADGAATNQDGNEAPNRPDSVANEIESSTARDKNASQVIRRAPLHNAPGTDESINKDQIERFRPVHVRLVDQDAIPADHTLELRMLCPAFAIVTEVGGKVVEGIPFKSQYIAFQFSTSNPEMPNDKAILAVVNDKAMVGADGNSMLLEGTRTPDGILLRLGPSAVPTKLRNYLEASVLEVGEVDGEGRTKSTTLIAFVNPVRLAKVVPAIQERALVTEDASLRWHVGNAPQPFVVKMIDAGTAGVLRLEVYSSKGGHATVELDRAATILVNQVGDLALHWSTNGKFAKDGLPGVWQLSDGGQNLNAKEVRRALAARDKIASITPISDRTTLETWPLAKIKEAQESKTSNISPENLQRAIDAKAVLEKHSASLTATNLDSLYETAFVGQRLRYSVVGPDGDESALVLIGSSDPNDLTE